MKDPAFDANWRELLAVLKKMGLQCPPKSKHEKDRDFTVGGVIIDVSRHHLHEALLTFDRGPRHVIDHQHFMRISLDQLPVAIAFMEGVDNTRIAIQESSVIGKFIDTVYTEAEKAKMRKHRSRRHISRKAGDK